MNHGIPGRGFVERETLHLDFDDPTHVLIAVVLMGDIRRRIIPDPGNGKLDKQSIIAQFTLRKRESFRAEIPPPVTIRRNIGPLLDRKPGLVQLLMRDGFEKLDLKSVGDITQGHHFVKRGGKFIRFL